MSLLKTIKDVFVTNVNDTSPTVTINKVDLAKLFRTSILVGVAAVLSSVITDLDPQDLGKYQPFIMLVLTVSLEFVNKLLKKNS